MGQQVVITECGCPAKPRIYRVLHREAMGQHAGFKPHDDTVLESSLLSQIKLNNDFADCNGFEVPTSAWSNRNTLELTVERNGKISSLMRLLRTAWSCSSSAGHIDITTKQFAVGIAQ